VLNVNAGRLSMPTLRVSTLRRVSSLSNLRRTSARGNFANIMRPEVAATAATTDSKIKLLFGIVRSMNDIVVHVGGAKAGNNIEDKNDKE